MYSKEQKDIAALRIYHQTESVTETIRIFESYRVQTQTWIGHLDSPRKCPHPPLGKWKNKKLFNKTLKS